MVELGTFDADVDLPTRQQYLENARRLMLGTDQVPFFQTQLRGEGEWKSLTPVSGEPMKVVDVQRFLTAAGFFPFGKADGICGYRTTSAIRLFQEYLRTHGLPGFAPDGQWGAKSTEQARAWQAAGTTAGWSQWSPERPSPEHSSWLRLLAQTQAAYVANPTPMITLVNAAKAGSDTVKPADWDLDPKKIHLIGIRRHESVAKSAQVMDDLFVLLINGLVFKFVGSTEPGVMADDANAYPFLVTGQHRYRFGWHKQRDGKKIFQALKPATSGVLVVRSKDLALTVDDLTSTQAERNVSINVHWGPDPTWSAGCQILKGHAYIDPQSETRDCSAFAATGYTALGTKRNGVVQTKGAYTVLADLVTAFSGTTVDDSVVRYMLVTSLDVARDPELERHAGLALRLLGSA